VSVGGARVAAVLLVALALGAASCEGRSPAHAGKPQAVAAKGDASLAIVDLAGGAPEVDARGVFPLASHRSSFAEAILELDALRDEPEVKGAFVRFGTARFGLARAIELGASLRRAADAGKPVHCHAESFNNASLAVAARGCTHVTLAPSGGVDANGIAAEIAYYRKFLADELRITLDILQVGKYKGAEEPFTRDGPSEEARASLIGTLSDLRAAWHESVAAQRPQLLKGKIPALEDGPYAANEALERGLVDALAYADDAREQARKAVGAARDDVRFGARGADKADDLADVFRAVGVSDSATAPIAVVRAEGAISSGGADGPFDSSSGIRERELGRLIARLEKSDSTKAVVLRIDSPGGSALASDLLWHALMRLRAKKPLVVSIGDMAASGGYYLACTGTKIVADPTSIIGSIGVVGGKMTFGAAAERWGIHHEVFPASPHPGAASRAAMESLLEPWDAATRGRVFGTMSAIYTLFLERVAVGRGLTVQEIAPSAEGRIFSGRQALERKLIDQLGGLHEAIGLARELAHLGPDAEVAFPEARQGLLQLLDGLETSFGARSGAVAAVESVRGFSPIKAAALEALGPLAPLASGERTVTAMPFRLEVR
jgi:protease-4